MPPKVRYRVLTLNKLLNSWEVLSVELTKVDAERLVKLVNYRDVKMKREDE
jgi:hypothetical protein